MMYPRPHGSIDRFRKSGVGTAITALLLVSFALLSVGCGSKGTLIVQRRGSGEQVFESRFDEVIYRFEDDNGATLVMLRGNPDAPEAAATIRLFWRARAGTTPMESTATNATMHYIIFEPDAEDAADDTTGEGAGLAIYSGAGFLLTDGKPGSATFKGRVTGATLRLSDHTAAFEEAVTRADLSGNILARRDDAAASQLITRINRIIRQRLGRARLVDAGPAQSTP